METLLQIRKETGLSIAIMQQGRTVTMLKNRHQFKTFSHLITPSLCSSEEWFCVTRDINFIWILPLKGFVFSVDFSLVIVLAGVRSYFLAGVNHFLRKIAGMYRVEVALPSCHSGAMSPLLPLKNSRPIKAHQCARAKIAHRVETRFPDEKRSLGYLARLFLSGKKDFL